MNLRDYQQQLTQKIFTAWNEVRYVLAVLPTGGGKTITFAHIVHWMNQPTIVLAHRANLIIQMSMALAREGIRHRVVGPQQLAKLCVRAHMRELGHSYYDATAMVGVGSVQSVTPYKDSTGWFNQVTLWVHDEAHHLLRDNQFGRAVARFPNARGLGVTATPKRADGKGLGAHADGYFERMVKGPTPKELMARGFLCQYKYFAPPSTLNVANIRVGADGDFNKTELREATRDSSVIGDIVENYCKNAGGLLGLTFADSIENAEVIKAKFLHAQVPAEILTGSTHIDAREKIIDLFKMRDYKQIVSVALIDEGFDCPAVEVISDGAASDSLSRFLQRFGRGWRPEEKKPYLMYFDHVNNYMRHGMPDADREWTLDRAEKRKKKDGELPVRVCVACLQVYEAVSKKCPYCDHYEPPAARTGPEFVDGDLTELDPAVLAALRGEIARIDDVAHPPMHLDQYARMAVNKRHVERQQAQQGLRGSIAWWAGLQAAQGREDAESYRRFYYKFGIDVANAQTLNAKDAEELAGRVNRELARSGIDGNVSLAQ